MKRKLQAGKPAAPQRASEREGIKLEVSRLTERGRALGNLMMEQSRTEGCWETFYLGSQAEFVGAGVPEYLFALHDRPVKFRANSQDACIQRKGRTYELTLHWDHLGPAYLSAEHPALSELARMIHCDVHYWLTSARDYGLDDTLEVPVEKLLADGRATDYRLPENKRFRFAKGFRSQIFSLASALYHAVKNAEIMPMQTAPVVYEPDDAMEKIENAKQAAQSEIKRIANRAQRQGGGAKL